MIDEHAVLEVANRVAPELSLHGYAADARARICTLGCTSYLLVAGRTPFSYGFTF